MEKTINKRDQLRGVYTLLKKEMGYNGKPSRRFKTNEECLDNMKE